jgi:hypothetical protein
MAEEQRKNTQEEEEQSLLGLEVEEGSLELIYKGAFSPGWDYQPELIASF